MTGEPTMRWTGTVLVCLTCGAQPLAYGYCPVHPPVEPRTILDQHVAGCDLALPTAIRPPAPVCTCSTRGGAVG